MFSIFVSFAPPDEAYCQRIAQQLTILKRNGSVGFEVFACSDTQQGWEEKMRSSRVVLLLVSNHYMASDHCYEHQTAALQLSVDTAGHRVVPIILSPCDWQVSPLNKLAALPTPAGFYPVSDTAKWPSPDAAYQNIAESLRKSVVPWAGALPPLLPPMPAPAPPPESRPRSGASPTRNAPPAANDDFPADALVEGFLRHHIPKVMFVGQEYPCKIGLSKARPENLDGETQVEPISVSRIMEVELAEETAGTFALRRETDRRQVVDGFGKGTEWLFYAKPLQNGQFKLLLKVTALLRVAGAEEHKQVVLLKEVDIAAQCRILFMGANPSDQTQLQMAREVRDIEEGLLMAQQRDRFDLEDKLAVRARDIIGHMLHYRPHIVHFSGHGSGEAGLAFETDQGRTQVVPTEPLAQMFGHFSDTVQCVLLNACYSEEQARAIVEHVPFVIGMDSAIPDKAALVFSVAFYKALASGENFVSAFELARLGLSFEFADAAKMPVLYQKNTA